MQADRMAGLGKDFILIGTVLRQFKCCLRIRAEDFENIADFNITHGFSSAL